MAVKHRSSRRAGRVARAPAKAGRPDAGVYVPDKPEIDPAPSGQTPAGREQVTQAWRFLPTCPTYSDRLVPRTFKGEAGCGCMGQNDRHRKDHCRAFACKLLAKMLSDVAGERAAG